MMAVMVHVDSEVLKEAIEREIIAYCDRSHLSPGEIEGRQIADDVLRRVGSVDHHDTGGSNTEIDDPKPTGVTIRYPAGW